VADWIALVMFFSVLCSAIVPCSHRPSPRYEFILGAVEHLARRMPADVGVHDRQATSSTVQRERRGPSRESVLQ